MFIRHQCCSEGQNPKAKDEGKARTLKAEAKAWTLEAKTKTKAWTTGRPGRHRPFKTEAKAWTLETWTKARTLESKANFEAKSDSQFNANIPHAIDMMIAPISFVSSRILEAKACPLGLTTSLIRGIKYFFYECCSYFYIRSLIVLACHSECEYERNASLTDIQIYMIVILHVS